MAIPSYLPQQANIKAYYALEDVNDSSGNGYNLTNNNSVTFTTAKVGNGANFGASNTNKYLRVASDLGIAAGAISIFMIVKHLASSSGNTWGLFTKADSGTHVDYSIFDDSRGGSPGIIIFRRTKYGVGYNEATFNLDLYTSEFHSLCTTYDGSNMRIYHNGVIAATPVAASGNGGAGMWDETTIGSLIYEGTPAGFSSSLIDETTIWNAALTGDEILSLHRYYNSKKGGIAIGSPWIFLKEAFNRHKKLWTPEGLKLPKDLGFSY